MTTVFTKHMNLEKPDETTKSKFAVYNSDLDKIERGYQLLIRAAEPITQYAAVYIDNITQPGSAYNATAGASAIGLANLSAAASGADIYVTVEGVLVNAAWTWTPGKLVYVSAVTPGALTQTPTAQVIGLALSLTELYVLPPYRRQSVVVVDRSLTDAVISNTSSEASAFATLIPKKLLGAVSGLRLTMVAKALNNSAPASGVNLRVRGKLDTVTFFDTGDIALAQNASARAVEIEMLILAQGGPTAQRAQGLTRVGSPGTTLGVASQDAPWHAVYDSLAVNMDNADRMLAVTVQFSIGNSQIVFTTLGLRLEVLP